MRTVVDPAISTGGSTTYRIHVERPGEPKLILVPDDATVATLEVNGTIVQRVGPDVLNAGPPIGHGIASLLLQEVGPTDQIAVHITGSATPTVQVLDDIGVLATISGVSRANGAFYALLAIAFLLQIAGLFSFFNPTSVWYAVFLLSMIGLEAARDGNFLGRGENDLAIVAFALAPFFIFNCYCSNYLLLRQKAPRLFRMLVASTLVPVSIAACVMTITRRPIDNEAFVIPELTTLFLLVIICVLRRRSGYIPATYLCFGLSGMTFMYATKVIRDLFGIPCPLLDRWSFEIGGAFDAFAFSLAVMYRSQFMVREAAKMQGDLDAAKFAATHDALTGLWNRRGLIDCYSEAGMPAATVFYLDIDGFKGVNDGGGHAAGDETLRVLAAILLNAVRQHDVVARIGGDEFVVLFTDEIEPSVTREIIERISAAVCAMRPLGTKDPTRIGVSIGVGRCISATNIDAALAEADADAYRVKSEHRLMRQSSKGHEATSIAPKFLPST